MHPSSSGQVFIALLYMSCSLEWNLHSINWFPNRQSPTIIEKATDIKFTFMASNYYFFHTLTILISPLVLGTLCVIFPFFCIFRIVLFLYRLVVSENMKGKVVLITGASSGIGEVRRPISFPFFLPFFKFKKSH